MLASPDFRHAIQNVDQIGKEKEIMGPIYHLRFIQQQVALKHYSLVCNKIYLGIRSGKSVIIPSIPKVIALSISSGALIVQEYILKPES